MAKPQHVHTHDAIGLYDLVFLNGGFTASLETCGCVSAPPDGYAVSAAEIPAVIEIGAASPALFLMTLDELRDSFPRAAGIAGLLYEGLLFLDPIEIYSSREMALHLARMRNQPAILDLSTGAEILV